MSLARGGQTLLTQAARAALGDALADAAAIERHGHYRLKGIAEPVEIFELGVRDRSSFAPPDDTEKAVRVVRGGRRLAAGARGAPQPAARARRLRRQERRTWRPSRRDSTPARGC